ncbi:MAG: damage-control phosphatase ARMT1 family protein [Anaerolineae bacterium]
MLPLPLMVSTPGSFAEHTIAVRKPGIIAKVLATQHYAPDIVTALQRFGDEVREGVAAPLKEDCADRVLWNRAMSPWEGRRWMELPWFLAETYFYRRLLEAVRYFQPGPTYLLDPFEPQKRDALGEGLEATVRFYAGWDETWDLRAQVLLAMRRSLWGNRSDLSNITVTASSETDSDEQHRILIDHRAIIWDLLAAGRVRRLDFVADNSGPEILADMGLIGLLLAHNLVREVHLHLKPQPFFVSDTMPKDYRLARRALEDLSAPRAKALGMQLRQAQEAKRLILHSHAFWSTSAHLTELPAELKADLAKADLILLKGDVNYRRLLEDRDWPPTTDLAAVTRGMPAPFVALRTLKAELIVGMAEGQAEAIRAADPDWLVNGERGVIHYVNVGR